MLEVARATDLVACVGEEPGVLCGTVDTIGGGVLLEFEMESGFGELTGGQRIAGGQGAVGVRIGVVLAAPEGMVGIKLEIGAPTAIVAVSCDLPFT